MDPEVTSIKTKSNNSLDGGINTGESIFLYGLVIHTRQMYVHCDTSMAKIKFTENIYTYVVRMKT